MQSTIPDKLQPHNVEAEEALLGAALIDYDTLTRVSRVGIAAVDFYIARYGWLWQVIKDLKTSNLVSITDELARRGQLTEFGGPAAVTQLINSCPSILQAEQYAGIIKRDSVKRQAIEAAGEIARLAYREDTTETEVLSEAGNLITQISKNNLHGQSKTMMELGNMALDKLELMRQNPNAIYGLPTGLTDLDKMLGGLNDGTLIIFAGVPGSGKTSLATQISVDLARFHQKRTLFISVEMTDEELHLRQQAFLSGIDSKRIKSGDIKEDEWGSLLKAITELSSLPIIIDDETNNTDDIRARAIVENERNGLDLIIVDSIQRLQSCKGSMARNRAQQVGEMARALKDLSKELRKPIIGLSSMSRNYSSRSDKRPIMSDLKESGDIESEADIVIFTHREVIFDPDTEFPNITELIIAKHRSGPIGELSVYFNAPLTRFRNLEKRTVKLEQIGEHYANK